MAQATGAYAYRAYLETLLNYGPVFSDIFFTDCLLLSFVDMKFVLNRNGKEFCLVASEDDADYSVKLTDVSQDS